MTASEVSFLNERAVFRLTGRDCASFLQGLVTADIARLVPGQATWAALLTPQGKILFDFLILDQGEGYLVDCARDQLSELVRRLGFYKLRADVSLMPDPGAAVIAYQDNVAPELASFASFRDPRVGELGYRAVVSADAATALGSDNSAYQARRILLGVPESMLDIESGELFPHEANLDQLGGVSFTKGCYVGQEVVSRMEHRGTGRSRILPVIANQPVSRGSEVLGRERKLGRILSTAGNRALALIRLDRLAEALATGDPITADGAKITVERPTWARFNVPGAAAA